MKLAIEVTEPESSISLPNSAPSRKSGKNWAKKPAPLRMNVWVQWARIGSRETNAAMTAATGASKRTLQPLKANQIRTPRPRRMPRRPIRSEPPIVSHLLEQRVEVGGRPLAEGVAVLGEEGAGGAPPVLLQHLEKLRPRR